MTKDEALKLALEALISCELSNYGRDWVWPVTAHEQAMKGVKEAITAIKEALAQPERDPWREAVAQPKIDPWREAVAQPDEVVRQGRRMSKQKLTEASREFSAQPEERNFCSRCGKRTADLTTIHTCTPPQEKDA